MRMHSERGAIIIHVAIALLALLAFTTFVVDQGMLFVARGQAQTAADAGALAGANALLLDPVDSTGAEQAARHFANVNGIWGQATDQAHIVVPTPPIACPDGIAACVRVDVMRGQPDRANQPHANTFPMFFGYMAGLTDQGTRATATAQVGRGNAVQCIKPWIVVDKWQDNSVGQGVDPNAWDQADSFDPGVDTYTQALGFTASGTPNNIGTQLMMKGDQNEWSAGWSQRIELGGGNGASTYMDEIVGCPEWVPTVGLYDPQFPCLVRADVNLERGCAGVRPGVAQGPTDQNGVQELIALDSTAKWDTGTNTVVGGCTTAGNCSTVNPMGIGISPRIVPIALFDPQACVNTSCHTGNNSVAQITNILGFFIEGMCNDVYPNQATRPAWCGTNAEAGKMLVGRLMAYPGQYSSVSGSAGPQTFVKVVRLIR
jgi:hypothetical protein